MCCLDYIPLLKAGIDEYIKNFQSRRILFEELAKVFGTPLEYDVVEFKKISFAVDINLLVVLLTCMLCLAALPSSSHQTCIVTLPPTFPLDSPQVNLSTLSVTSRTSIPKQIARSITKYPYSPRWTMDEMAKRLKYDILYITS